MEKKEKENKDELHRVVFILHSCSNCVVSSATTRLFLSITRKLDDFTFPPLNYDALTQVNENARFRQF